jgi:Zn finger protein HypA/HybF involved in hydrogenase expression
MNLHFFCAACPSGKKRYLFARDASKAAKRIRKKLQSRQHPYRCPHCKNWHLTTDKPKRPAVDHEAAGV